MNIGDEVFIAYPSAVQWEKKGNASDRKGKKAKNHLLWGDWARVLNVSGKWIEVSCRKKSGWVHSDDLQQNRILEVNFVDVGQGDGAHIQTPNDSAIVVDAGIEDNLFRFLRWRFGKFKKKFKFESAIITHPDKDHYYGFKYLFEHPKVEFGAVYHNGIIEQVTSGKNSLGKIEKPRGAKKKCITGLALTRNDLKKVTDSPAKRGKRLYPNMLHSADKSGRVGNFIGLMASTDLDNPIYLTGYAPSDQNGMTVKILGPLPTNLPNGKQGLPTFGSKGKTKNGHSVILQIEIGDVSIQLGGDLNEPSQDYLLENYTGLSHPPHNMIEEQEIISAARTHFEADVTKACHHGSLDISTTFLQAVNPIATIVSSGDNEPHAHPQPATLGLVGKFGRGSAPLIFSTELARSTDEKIKNPSIVRAELRKTLEANEAILKDPSSTASQRTKAEAKIETALKTIERSVAKYGMINVRTDGKNVLIAQKLERDRSKSKRWDIHLLEPDQNRQLKYKKKKGH